MKAIVPKKDTMIYHTKKRFLERFNLELSNKDIKSIISQIQKKVDCLHLYKISNLKSVYVVKAFQIVFCVIYSKKYKTLHTVMPLDWIYDGSFRENLESKDIVGNVDDEEIIKSINAFIKEQ